MKQEFFNARLLQIQLEMEAVKAEIAGMTSENLFRATIGHDLTHDQGVLFGMADQLRSLQGDIKALMEEYSKGEETPATEETKPGTLASAKGIIAGLGNMTESTMGGETSLGWRNIDSRKVSVVVAALQVLLRPAAGDNERLYTLNEMHRCYMQGRSFCHLSDTDGSAESNFESFIQDLEDAGE